MGSWRGRRWKWGHIILNILHLEMSSGSMISAKGGNGGIPFEGSDEKVSWLFQGAEVEDQEVM